MAALALITRLSAADLPALSPDQIMATARSLAEHVWTVKSQNLVAPCKSGARYQGSPYKSDYADNQRVVGLPYDWGGMDGIDEFDRKLFEKFAVGSHKEHECESCGRCTAGTDCSGFVSYCWGQRTTKLSTNSIATIGKIPPRSFDVFKDLTKGDALNKAGDHIVLFDSYAEDGRPVVYEAEGRPVSRVLKHKRSWADLDGFVPLRYRNVVPN